MVKSLCAEVVEVHSGDDLILLVDLGIDQLFKRVRARLDGVDTPDAFKAGRDTKAGQIREEVWDVVKGRKCRVDIVKEGKPSWKVKLYLGLKDDSPCLNDLLIQQGYVYEK